MPSTFGAASRRRTGASYHRYRLCCCCCCCPRRCRILRRYLSCRCGHPSSRSSRHRRSSRAATAVEPPPLSELPPPSELPLSGPPPLTTEEEGVYTQMTPTSGPCSSFPRPVSIGDKPLVTPWCCPQDPLLLSTYTHGPVASVQSSASFPCDRCFHHWGIWRVPQHEQHGHLHSSYRWSPFSVSLSSPSSTQLTSASLPCTSFQTDHGQVDYDVHPLAVHLGGSICRGAPFDAFPRSTDWVDSGVLIYPVCLHICLLTRPCLHTVSVFHRLFSRIHIISMYRVYYLESAHWCRGLPTCPLQYQ